MCSKRNAGFYKTIFLSAVVILIGSVITSAAGQKHSDPDTIDINRVQLSLNIASTALWHVGTETAVTSERLPAIVFNNTIPVAKSEKVSASLIQKYIYLKFVVKNTADTAIGFYFLPGYYYSEIALYKVNVPGADVQEEALHTETMGFKKIKLEANQTSVFFCRIKFVRTTINTLDPSLIRDYYLAAFIATNQNAARSINIITFVFSGVLLMMIFYSLAVSLRNKNTEFAYYSGFAFCLGSMLFLKSYLFQTPSSFNYFFEAYFDFVLQAVGTFIYMIFLRKFVEARKNFTFLYKMLLFEQMIIIVSLLLFSYLYFGTDNYLLQVWVENINKYIWLLSTVVFIVYTCYAKNKLLNYLAVGHFFLLLGGLLSLYMMQSSAGFRKHLPIVLNSAIFYYEAGLTIELVFFLAALAFKNKNDIVEQTKESERLKLKDERQEFEKQVAVFSAKQEERNRISADMHDELGSGVTAIRLMSELVKSKMKEETLPEINKISSSANDLINKMNTLIWSMKSENDSLESLILYIRIYALEFFENTAIECLIEIPDSLPDVELSGEKRRNIFLSVKETLKNVLKHSKGDRVQVSFEINRKLVITITDNGVGINSEKLRHFGSGLKNVKKRIEGIDGIYRIEKNEIAGTNVRFELEL
ncbi:MAG: sensor histidine kinase [Chitinophagaceae bacterium]